jgi:adenine C2-methylase RlmN of 23S rRNA A2503 and tRNA A37
VHATFNNLNLRLIFAVMMQIPQAKTDIRALSLAELKGTFTQMGEKAFRGGQVFEWLWKKSAHSFDEMSNLSKDLREKLKEHFVIIIRVFTYHRV